VQWSSGRVPGSTHTRSTASNLEQVANLLCPQANSAFYPQRDGKWVAMVCLLAAPWVHLSVSAGNGWPRNALRHHWLMPISCHFRDCKALLVASLTHVSGAVTSVLTFLPFILKYSSPFLSSIILRWWWCRHESTLCSSISWKFHCLLYTFSRLLWCTSSMFFWLSTLTSFAFCMTVLRSQW